jgi:hypothetical protein
MATTMSLRSLAMAMADAALQPAHKLLPTVSLPLLSSSTRAAPLLLRANRRLPLAPLVASSDAVEAGVEWADNEEEEVVGDAFDEEVGEAEEEVVASGDEEEEGGDGDGEYAAVEPPEEAKVYVGNLPYDVDSEGLAQLFDQAGVVEVAEVRAGCCSPNFPPFLNCDVLGSVRYNWLLCLCKARIDSSCMWSVIITLQSLPVIDYAKLYSLILYMLSLLLCLLCLQLYISYGFICYNVGVYWCCCPSLQCQIS